MVLCLPKPFLLLECNEQPKLTLATVFICCRTLRMSITTSVFICDACEERILGKSPGQHCQHERKLLVL